MSEGFIIELNDGDFPRYWGLGQSIHPAGSWGEKKDAVAFSRTKDAQAFIACHLRAQAELCKVLAYKL